MNRTAQTLFTIPTLAAGLAVGAATVPGGTAAAAAEVASAPSGQISTSATTAKTWTVTVGSQAHGGAFQGMNYGSNEIWIDVGDSVHWVAASMEPHTVTFGIDRAHPFGEFGAPGNEYMVAPTSQPTIGSPGDFRNSGVLTTMPSDLLPSAVPQRTTYDLTFTGSGTYDYCCYVHGKVQHGIVHVAARGTRTRISKRGTTPRRGPRCGS